MRNDRSPAHYRSLATRYTYRRPILTALSTQVNFWIAANTVLVFVSHLVLRAAAVTYQVIQPPPLFDVWLIAMVTAIVYGITLGLIDMWVERRFGTRSSLGIRILLKAAFYTVAFILISGLTVLAFENVLMDDWFRNMGMRMTAESRVRWALTFVPTTLVGNVLISFIKQVNRSFGPGLLMSILLGRYRNPVHERRIFMFMDLKGSTAHAEELGPERYSSMIRDLFRDVDSVLPRFEAEIYQYVGDEVVFTWNANELKDPRACVLFYFAVERAVQNHADHYLRTYGRLPTFKAGMHVGDVVAVEVGEIKRDIAYHGDPINTAARIQSMCNEYGKQLLVSEELATLCALDEHSLLQPVPLGSVLLRGKQQHVTICSIEERAFAARNMDPTFSPDSMVNEPASA